jgi:hypothetical protein
MKEKNTKTPKKPDKSYKAWWFRDKNTGQARRTPVLAKSLAEAKQLIKRPKPENAVLVKVRDLTDSEHKQASKGKWIKGDFNRDQRGYGPQPKEYQKDKIMK